MEGEAGTRRIYSVVQIKQAGKLESGLDSVTADDFGQNVIPAIGPLVQVAGSICPKELRGRSRRVGIIEGGATDCVDIILRQSKRRLRIRSDFVPAPPRRV